MNDFYTWIYVLRLRSDWFSRLTWESIHLFVCLFVSSVQLIGYEPTDWQSYWTTFLQTPMIGSGTLAQIAMVHLLRNKQYSFDMSTRVVSRPIKFIKYDCAPHTLSALNILQALLRLISVTVSNFTHPPVLCSTSDTLSLQIPCTMLPCTFSIFGPSTWNEFPLPLWQKPSLGSFRSKNISFPKIVDLPYFLFHADVFIHFKSRGHLLPVLSCV